MTSPKALPELRALYLPMAALGSFARSLFQRQHLVSGVVSGDAPTTAPNIVANPLQPGTWVIAPAPPARVAR